MERDKFIIVLVLLCFKLDLVIAVFQESGFNWSKVLFLICVYNIALFMLLGWDEEYIKKNHMLQTSNVSASQNVGDEMT